MSMQKIGFIGLGLIGGSIALTAKKNQPDLQIIASARRAETIKKAYDMGILTNEEPACLEDFSDCDYLFLCAPVEKNIAYLEQLKEIIKPDCIITDVGSTKAAIHKKVAELGLEANFIGGHPMTGSEKTGIENADICLLENAYYILTPTSKTDEERLAEFKAFVESLGSIPLILDYEIHDQATAAVSHLPHMISYSLVHLVKNIDDENETMKRIAAGGFRDMTRIAASSPVMWQSICSSNSGPILRLMDQYIETLQDLREQIAEFDENGLIEYFQDAKDYRDSLFIANKKFGNICYEIFIDLADETGEIAVISSLLAFQGISIKNIGIINNREYEEGVLRIEFDDEETLNKAIEVLKNRNYKVYKR